MFIKARSGISFTYSNSGNFFSLENYQNENNKKTKNIERKRRRKLNTVLYTVSLLV